MSPVRMSGTLTLFLVLGLTARAETVPYETTISAAEIEVRSGKSPQFYATSRLRQGDRVKVVREEDGGWLAIAPPPGSFSWINDRLLDHKGPQTGIVLAADTPVLVGSSLTNQKPNVQQVKVGPGTLVVILSKVKEYNEEGGWVQIQPVPQEVRYIPADAVKVQPGQVQTVNASPAPGADGRAPVAQDSLWYQADQAEKAGNPAEAERLFLQLANQTSDHDLQIRCYNRIHFLREGSRGSVPPGYQPGRPAESSYPGAANPNRLVPAPYNQPGYPYSPPARATSQYTYTREIAVPPGTSQPVRYGQVPPPLPAQWSEAGWLRRAPFWVDSRPTYVLESSQGTLRLYVTAQPGVNLDSYLNRNVYLYGPIGYRGDLRTNYMTVAQVKPLP